MPLENRKTVTADWYANHCLSKVFQAWCKLRPRTGVRGRLLHHDSASKHTAAATFDFLDASNVQLVTHPPYSPDLAPYDWFLFPSVKRQLKGEQFQNTEDARSFFEDVILDIPESTWSGVIDIWLERMVKRVQAEGWGGGGFLKKKPTGVDKVVVSVVERPDCKT